MDLNYGINGSFSVEAARPVTVESSTAIVIVASANAGDFGFHKFNNAEDGLTYVSDTNITEGTLKAALTGIYMQGVNCPIVAILVDDALDDVSKETAVLNALDTLSSVDSQTGISPILGLLIAPEFSADLDIGTKLSAMASKYWMTAIIDDFSSDEAGTKAYVENFASRFTLHSTGRTKLNGIMVPNSSCIAGVVARYDYEPFGWAKSHSNRVVEGAAGTDREIEFIQGADCEARRLRQEGICMVLKNQGWRTYGFETRDIDPIWQALDRVRTFYRCMDAIVKASLWALDREADQLLEVKKTITEFMNELVGNGVVIGFEVYFDPKKNTKATVTAGKFYLTVKFQDMPSIRELNIELVYTDAYSEVLINFLNQGE